MYTNLDIEPSVLGWPEWEIYKDGGTTDYHMYWDEDILGVTASRRYNHYDGNTLLGLTAMEYHVGIPGQDGAQTNSDVVYRIDTIAIMEPEDTNTPGRVVTNFSDYVKAPACGTTNWGQPHTIQPPDEDGQIYLDILSPRLVPDWNRDKKIDSSDENQATASNPFRFWKNDDDDRTVNSGNDIPGEGPSDLGDKRGVSPHIASFWREKRRGVTD